MTNEAPEPGTTIINRIYLELSQLVKVPTRNEQIMIAALRQILNLKKEDRADGAFIARDALREIGEKTV